MRRTLLICVLIALFLLSVRVIASPPVVNSPVVVQMHWTVTANIRDENGYVQTTADCVSPYTGQTVPAGTVLKMIVNPNGHPKSDPSVWGVTYDNRYVQGVIPLDGSSNGFYLPVSCLEGVRPSP